MAELDVNQAKRKLDTIAQFALERVQTALEIAGNELLTESKPLVPVDTGELANSGYVKVKPGEVEVGFTAEYAAKVHEDLTIAHDRGQSKFLEQPLNAKASRLPDEIARRAKL